MVYIPSRPPSHRQNRRRERPGARTRKALSMRENIQHDFEEGISVARDRTILLPSEKYPPCSCEGCFAERAFNREEMDGHRELESEQRRLFGGDVGDDELRRLGILSQSESAAADEQEAPPQFFIRPARPKRGPRASRVPFQLPEYLAASLLSDSPEIARWMFQQSAVPSYPSRITIQHRNASFPTPAPQSLPQSIANSVIPDISCVASSPFPASPLLFPLERDDEELSETTWDFITSSTRSSAPPSEPETWILLSDGL